MAQAADEALKPILDLHKTGKLLVKAEYKAVRAAAAHVFATRHADVIKEAFGDDHTALTAWLDKHKDLKEEFFSAIHPQKDDVPRTLAIFRDLWKADPDAVAKYPNLAIAISVVWDQPRKRLRLPPHQVRTKSNLPDGYLSHGPQEEFQYHIAHAKAVQGKEALSRLEVLPWEFLVYVVNHRTPVDERDWAVKNYLAKRPMIGKIYQEIEYDEEMLRTQSEVCKLNGTDYTLPEHPRSTAASAPCRPTSRPASARASACRPSTSAARRNARRLHAWVMWVEVKSVSKDERQLLSSNRTAATSATTTTPATLHRPADRREILDRDMERRLSAAAHRSHRQAPGRPGHGLLPGRREGSRARRQEEGRSTCSGAEVFDVQRAGLAGTGPHVHRDGEVTADSKSLVLEQTQRLLTAFAKYPDFSWKVADDLLIAAEGSGRPQPVLSSSWRWSTRTPSGRTWRARPGSSGPTSWAKSKQWSSAATGLATRSRSSRTRGGTSPGCSTSSRRSAGSSPAARTTWARRTWNLSKMNPKRGNEVTKYFIKLSGEALAFFKAEKKTKEAAEVERISGRPG